MRAIRIFNSHNKEIRAHLLRLPLPDRYLRFFSAVSEEAIDNYVAKMDLDHIYGQTAEAGFGVFNARYKLIGFCHVAPTSPDRRNECEMAFSVDADHRNKGIGSALFDRAIIHCKSWGINTAFVNCLASNIAMKKMAENYNIPVTTEFGESVGKLNVDDKDSVRAFLRSVHNDTFALYDLNLRATYQGWLNFIENLTLSKINEGP